MPFCHCLFLYPPNDRNNPARLAATYTEGQDLAAATTAPAEQRRIQHHQKQRRRHADISKDTIVNIKNEARERRHVSPTTTPTIEYDRNSATTRIATAEATNHYRISHYHRGDVRVNNNYCSTLTNQLIVHAEEQKKNGLRRQF